MAESNQARLPRSADGPDDEGDLLFPIDPFVLDGIIDDGARAVADVAVVQLAERQLAVVLGLLAVDHHHVLKLRTKPKPKPKSSLTSTAGSRALIESATVALSLVQKI